MIDQYLEAVPGDLIGFSIGNIVTQDIHRGSIVFDPSSERPFITSSFTVQVSFYPTQPFKTNFLFIALHSKLSSTNNIWLCVKDRIP